MRRQTVKYASVFLCGGLRAGCCRECTMSNVRQPRSGTGNVLQCVGSIGAHRRALRPVPDASELEAPFVQIHVQVGVLGVEIYRVARSLGFAQDVRCALPEAGQRAVAVEIVH